MSHIIPEVEALAKEYSMDQCAAVTLQTPLTIDFYKTWLQQNHHGTMAYLTEHLDLKEHPEKMLPAASARTALVFTKHYLPHPRPLANSATRRALYAQGEDYHHWFKSELNVIATKLKEKFPDGEFIAMTDSSPVLERDLAHRAGLGWFGKNTCLIHPKKGSLFFIGEIYTTLSAANLQTTNGQTANPFQIEPIPDLCGKCTRCLDICPTQAFTRAKVLDANKCISFLTIESKTTPPIELREKIGDWFFGCDLCQTTCPWNEKVFRHQLQTSPLLSDKVSPREPLVKELREILTLSGKQLQKKFIGSALSRAGAFGLRRNAIIVATNRGLYELLPEIKNLSQDLRLVELVEWSSFRLSKLID